MRFEEFFNKATGNNRGPYPFQQRFAEAEPESLPQLVDVPTGLGKTAMAVLGWLWRRFHATEAIREATPRRLVYCLPMRVLVEQTRDNAVLWLHNLGRLGGIGDFEGEDGKKRLSSYTPDFTDPAKITVHVLMGGEDETDWAMWPEREAILIGTQDMLLSRALNRGYAAGRARWPMEFGLLHNDCLWVFDEIQLMGPSLATTAQLEGFRYLLDSKEGLACRSVWMSATMQRNWLKTVNFDPESLGKPLTLSEEDVKNDGLRKRWEARKLLKSTGASTGDADRLAEQIREVHKPGTRTIVIVNTVRRASDLCAMIARKWGSENDQRLILLHSRFRPGDRDRAVQEALADPPAKGTIVISTQVIEAGVDVSATTLFVEVAPWASLVQRFGRCNRKGEDNDQAVVHLISLPDEETFKRLCPQRTKGKDGQPKSAKQIAEAHQDYLHVLSRPYEHDDLKEAARNLKKLTDVGLRSLPNVNLLFKHVHVIRKKDLIDLFDTTPDLTGNDIDIDRFIRDVEETDVRVFWRTWEQPHKNDPPPDDEPAPWRDELCPAPVGEFRDFAKKQRGKVWRWDFLGEQWEKVDTARISPGQVYLVHADAGGYVADRGWTPQSSSRVEPVATAVETCAPESNEGDRYSRAVTWQTIAEHTDAVCSQLDPIARELSSHAVDALMRAARWHDRGKAHEIFVKALPDGRSMQGNHWAKAPGGWKRYERRHFRHELASALAVLDPTNKEIPDDLRDLVAYLVAAHHGKVRLSIRSLPNESRPSGNRRFARGVWEGDVLPETDLGGGIIAPVVKLSLEPMEVGLCEEGPFRDQPSWAERMIRLRDRLGPFRLAYLEALLRAADWRASQPEDHP